jgi:hypothetical protein
VADISPSTEMNNIIHFVLLLCCSYRWLFVLATFYSGWYRNAAMQQRRNGTVLKRQLFAVPLQYIFCTRGSRISQLNRSLTVTCLSKVGSFSTFALHTRDALTHRSKQGGLALSISDHMCQRVRGPIFLGKRVGWFFRSVIFIFWESSVEG